MSPNDGSAGSGNGLRVTVAILVPCAIIAGLWLVLRDRDRVPERVPMDDVGEIEPSSRAPELPQFEPESAETQAPAPSTTPRDEGALAAIAESSPEVVPAFDIDDDTGTLVYGRVTYVGAPTKDEYRGALSFHDAFGRRTVARTDDDGRYSLAGLTAGAWWVIAGRSGYVQQTRRVELENASIVRCDFELEAMPRLRVKLTTDEGGTLRDIATLVPGFRGLVPVATIEEPGEYFTEIIGSANNPYGVGSFYGNGYIFDQLPVEYLGTLLLYEEPPLYVSLVRYHDVLQTKRVAPGDEEVAFNVSIERLRSNGSLFARFVDSSTGEPVPDVRTSLDSAGAGAGGSATSDVDGIVRIADVAPGEYAWTARADGYARIAERLLVRRGVVTDLGDVSLSPACMLAGRVVDEHGDPVMTDVRIAPLDTDPSLRDHRPQSTRSAPDGSFTFDALAPGAYGVTVSNQNTGDETPLVSPIERVDLDPVNSHRGVELRTVASTSIVLRGGEIPLPSLRFEILDAQGFSRVARRFYNDAPVGVAVPLGVHRVRIIERANDAVILDETVEVGPDPWSIALP